MRRFVRFSLTAALALSAFAANPEAGGAPAAASVATTAASCTISKAAFPTVRLSDATFSRPLSADEQFSALTTGRDGLWAGFAYLAYPVTVALISWRPGHARASVLGRFGRNWQDYSVTRSLHVAGITPHHAIVIAVQTDRHEHRFAGYAWARGRLHRLAAHRTWLRTYPQVVTSGGSIYGWVRTLVDGHLRYQLVRWPTWRQKPRVLMTLSRTQSPSVIDSAGDATISERDGTTKVRLTSGTVRALAWPNGNQPVVSNAAGHSLYGEASDGLYRYDLASPPTTGSIVPTPLGRGMGVNNWVTSASSRGDLVTGATTQLLRTASGEIFRLPKAEWTAPFGGQGFNTRGVFAFTSARDGRPHFVYCS